MIKFLLNSYFFKTKLRQSLLRESICCDEINVGKTAFSLLEIALDKVFMTTFNSEIGLQFLMHRLSQYFFLMSLITACLYKILKILA